ncbi:histidine phosphatase family protein [Bacillus benzoevorans]|uniref:Putative phosphoglycerate mutase n=1 Tax=Bacillus benzoevorans TaxID=1456 RepID=A0A7X0HVR9_9BACI|nr:histidine phosphatase family protein [Bacillus benzoevorans]MBB6447676.1 putative phosphoglycerate mutase [Bacillus benzoevorans]
MLYLYIVRHGETEWNAAERIQGRLDSRLTEKGRSYAKRLGERLKDTEFTRIIASPSQRTLETAQLLRGERDIPVIQDERIMEMAMGPWQGMTKAEIRLQYPNEYDWFMSRPELYQNIGAETFFDMKERAEKFLAEMRNGTLNGNVLVVSHGLLIKALFAIFKGVEIKDIWKEQIVDGTSLSIVKIDREEQEILLESDMGHVTNDETVPRL